MGLSFEVSPSAPWRDIPACFFGYGLLYAWGYVSWSTDSLATQAVSGGEFDLSWLVSAAVVPALLLVLAVGGLRRELADGRAMFVAAPVLAAVGTTLSVACQYVGQPAFSWALSIVSGVCTGAASALFSLLWSLALMRLDMARLEMVVPVSFAASALCAVVVPPLPQLPALVVALLLIVGCALTLARARAWAEGQACAGADEGGGAALAEGVPAIVRMLAFGVVAWAVMNIAPMTSGVVQSGDGPFVAGMDASGAIGYLLSIVFALLIIRFAVRVDFQALSSTMLPVLALSMVLLALDSPASRFWAGVLNVALNSCCETVLLLYFIRIAQNRPERSAFWLALGSAASYLGVFVGQLMSGWCARMGAVESDPALFGLMVACAYAFAMALVPQRSYTAQCDCVGRAAGSTPSEAVVGMEGTSGFLGDKVWGADADGVPDPVSRGVARLAARYQLSAREAEVCEYLARGRSQVYIREALLLSKNTVSTYVRRIYAKLDVHSKQELIDLVEGRE